MCFHFLTCTVKKAFRYSRPQPGCHLPNSSYRREWFIYDVIIPAQGEFGKWHPGWGRECRKAFFTVWPVKVPWKLSPTVVGQTRPRNVEVDADARVEGMEGAGEHLQRSHHPRHGRLQGGQIRPWHANKDVVPRDWVQVHESWIKASPSMLHW